MLFVTYFYNQYPKLTGNNFGMRLKFQQNMSTNIYCDERCMEGLIEINISEYQSLVMR